MLYSWLPNGMSWHNMHTAVLTTGWLKFDVAASAVVCATVPERTFELKREHVTAVFEEADFETRAFTATGDVAASSALDVGRPLG